MRMVAALAILSRALESYIFQPLYISQGNDPLTELLAEVNEEDPAQEMHVRAVLLNILPDRQKENGEARVKKAMGKVFGALRYFVPADKRDSFEPELRKVCREALQVWQPLQRLQERVVADSVLVEPEEWSILRLPTSLPPPQKLGEDVGSENDAYSEREFNSQEASGGNGEDSVNDARDNISDEKLAEQEANEDSGVEIEHEPSSKSEHGEGEEEAGGDDDAGKESKEETAEAEAETEAKAEGEAGEDAPKETANDTTEEAGEEAAEAATEQDAEKPASEAGEGTTEDASKEASEETAEETGETTVKEPSEEPSEEPAEATEESTEVPAEETAEPAAEEPTAEATEEATEEAAEQTVEAPADDSEKKPADDADLDARSDRASATDEADNRDDDRTLYSHISEHGSQRDSLEDEEAELSIEQVEYEVWPAIVAGEDEDLTLLHKGYVVSKQQVKAAEEEAEEEERLRRTARKMVRGRAEHIGMSPKPTHKRRRESVFLSSNKAVDDGVTV